MAKRKELTKDGLHRAPAFLNKHGIRIAKVQMFPPHEITMNHFVADGCLQQNQSKLKL